MKTQRLTQSQKLMVFVLTMSLYGLATLFTELIPSFQVGIVEFSVEYFLFIPLVLAMLFDPMSAALGAATGELVFSEIMLGQFGGLGELEKFITVTIGVYIAGYRILKRFRDFPRVYLLQKALPVLMISYFPESCSVCFPRFSWYQSFTERSPFWAWSQEQRKQLWILSA